MLGISPMMSGSITVREDKYELPFTLIADPERPSSINTVWGEKQLYGRKYMGLHRTTFVLDEQGSYVRSSKTKTKQHAEEILQAWQQLGGKK